MTRPLGTGLPTSSRAPLTALAACLLVSACASGPRSGPERLTMIEDLTRAGEYARAAEASVELLGDLDKGSPLRPRVIQVQEEISLASGLDTVRTLLFSGREAEALALAERLDEEHPGSPSVAAWTDRVRRKIADSWFETARLAVAEGRFDDARKAYATSVRFDPTREVVQDLLTELDRVENWRAEVADEKYFDGVSNLVDGQLLEASGDFGKVAKYREKADRAARRRSEVNKLLAEIRVASARELVEQGHMSAAYKEYLVASELDPDSAEIAAQRDRMKHEFQADQLLIEGRSAILRGELEKGEEFLRQGLELSEMQDAAFEEELAGISERRTSAAYERALGLEHDFQLDAAVQAYESLLEGRDFYKDARARIDALRDKIATAERLYGEAMDTADRNERLALLRQIEVFWPDYRDIPQRIRALSGRE